MLQAIFVDIAAQKQSSIRDIRDAAKRFGQGIRQRWNWQKSDVLVLFTPNSTEIAAVSFGTLWAGGVVCPFNNLYTVGELVSQLKSSRAKALVTHVACLQVAREAALFAGLSLDRVILVGPRDPKGLFKHFSDLQPSSTDVQKVAINPSADLAYLVYSSGTTGLPKGVMLTHTNIVANVLQTRLMETRQMEWNRDKVIGLLPMYHIYGESWYSLNSFPWIVTDARLLRHCGSPPPTHLLWDPGLHHAEIRARVLLLYRPG